MSTEAVRVMVRCRVMNAKEKTQGCKVVVSVDRGRKEIGISDPADPENKKMFTFDDVFPMEITQKAIYSSSAFGIVENVISGYNGTIFAYGQTGCGKTYSMMGNPKSETLKGIIPRTFSQIMNVISSKPQLEFLVRVSFLEIYNENIKDLLGDTEKKLDVKEDKDKGIYVQDLSMTPCKSVDDMLTVMFKGDQNRSVGATAMNQDSSRSHSIFTIYIEVGEKLEASSETKFRAGKLNLVDLAGSERQSKTQASGQRLEEAKKINLSLSALGNVISALVAGGKKHIPYRDSKLTRLLQDSLGGNTKTLMIAAISPADYNYEETLGTLKYAARAKQIKNKPTVNEDPKDAMLKQLSEELKLLKAQLESPGKGGVTALAKSPANSEHEARLKEQEQLHQQYLEEEQQMAGEVQAFDESLAEQRRIREEMEQKLAMLKNAKVGGGQGKKPVVSAEDQKQYEEMKQEVEQQQEKEEQEQRIQEQKTKNIELITDDFDEMSQKYRELHDKYKQMCRDVRDTQHENVKEKAELVESLRFQEREVDFLRQIMSVVISTNELEQIKDQAHWDEEKEDWQIPTFEFYENGAQPPSRRESRQGNNRNQKSGYEIRLDNTAAAVSPPPREFGERSSKQFRVKNSNTNSRDIIPARAPSNTRLQKIDHNSDIFEGKLILFRWTSSLLQTTAVQAIEAGSIDEPPLAARSVQH